MAGPPLLLALGRSMRAATQLGEAMTRAGGEAYRSVMEHVDGIKMAKSYGAEERSLRLFGELADAHGEEQSAGRDLSGRCQVSV